LVTLCIGCGALRYRVRSVYTPQIYIPLGLKKFEGSLERIESKPDRWRLTVRGVWLEHYPWRGTPRKIRLSYKRKTFPFMNLQLGDRIQGEAVLVPPSKALVPGGYDFRQWAFFQKIGAVGFGTTRPVVIRKAPEVSSFLMIIERWRLQLTAHFLSTFPGQSGALLAALSTGDRSGISEETRQNFSISGIAHLLAISGLHFSIVAGIIYAVLRKAFCLLPFVFVQVWGKKGAALISLVVAFVYLLLSGLSITAQRAFIMLCFMIGAVMIDRQALSMRHVAYAACLLLLLYPEAVFGPSFQLSFAAVVGLIAYYESTERFAWRGHTLVQKLKRYGVGLGVSSVISTVATSPIALYTFNQASAYGLLTNFLAIPLTCLGIMPLLVLYLLLMLGGVEGVLQGVLYWCANELIELAERVGQWPGAKTIWPQIAPFPLILFYLGGVWLCLWQRSWRWWGVLPMCVVLPWIIWPTVPDGLYSRIDQLLGVRGSDSVLYIYPRSRARSTYLTSSWQRYLGCQSIRAFPKPGKATTGGLTCETQRCILRRGGKQLSVDFHAEQERKKTRSSLQELYLK